MGPAMVRLAAGFVYLSLGRQLTQGGSMKRHHTNESLRKAMTPEAITSLVIMGLVIAASAVLHLMFEV